MSCCSVLVKLSRHTVSGRLCSRGFSGRTADLYRKVPTKFSLCHLQLNNLQKALALPEIPQSFCQSEELRWMDGWMELSDLVKGTFICSLSREGAGRGF